MRIHIDLLGEFTVRVGHRTIRDAWEQRRALDLVKVLAVEPTHRLHREQVVEALWPHLATEAAFANLHRAASHARTILGAKESVVLRGGQVRLWPDASISTDVEQYEAAADRALRSGNPQSCVAAAARYGPGLLPGDVYAEWTATARDRLRDLQLRLLRRAGRWDAVIEHEPGDEEAHRELVRTMVADGRRNAALRACQDLRKALAELGLGPGPETLRLWRELSLVATPISSAEQDQSPLVGREQELAAARALLHRAGLGRAGTLLVAGGAGIGKTRFCESLLSHAGAQGWTTLHGAANRVEGAAPWAAVAEAFDRLLVQRPDLLGSLTAPAREGLAQLFGRSTAPTSGARPLLPGRQPVLSAVMQLLTGAARDRGAVLWIDDVHEADEATVQLLHYLARAARGERVLLVLAHRPERLTPGAAAVRSSLLAGQGATEIELGPLSEPETRVLVERLAGRRVPDAAVAAIHRLAEGNPFFSEELAAVLGPDGTLKMSRRLYEIVDGRVGALEPNLRATLQSVALVGTQFTAADLADLTDLDESGVLAALDAARQVGIIVESSGGYRFRHVLYRDALVALLPPHRRRAAHRRTADALATRRAAPGRVAHHLLAAGAGTEAVPWLERAARGAAAAGAVAVVRGLVDHALVHAPQRPSLLELRADCLFASGTPSSLAAYSEAIAAARGHRRRGLRIRQARAAVMLGDVATATRALDGLVPHGAVEKVRLHVARGYVALAQADLPAAERDATEARRIALDEGLVVDLTEAATLRALVAHSRGTWPSQIEADLLDTSRTPQLAASIHDGHLCVVEHYLYGDRSYQKLITFAERLRDTARHNGAERGEAFATLVLGEAELLAGRGDPAETHLREAVELHRRMGSSAGESLALQRLAEASLLHGRSEQAKTLLVRALDLARESSLLVRHLLPRIYGTMVRAAGNPAEALAVIDEAESATAEAREACRMCAITFAVPAAFACVDAGALPRARHYLALAKDVAPPLGRAQAWNAAIAELEAALATAEGDDAVAVNRLQTAADLFAAAGQPRDARRCLGGLALSG
ncbi:ATP-binding protein [Pseudonocardia hispaniensis]|uniref:ATP-binding protein n=1 Tax=Pseudonocardia hispaniensis TaxID=904933 RepID=A0ABW1J3A2_9PSEU